MTRTRRLRELIARDRLLVLPSTYDPLLARCVERAGFEALYMAGSGVANGTLAVPDLGMVTFPEMLERARLIADVTALPLLADAEDGFGAPLDIQRTVRAYERAGVAAVQLEDLAKPKRPWDEKRVIPRDRMIGHLRAALDARVDPDLVIIARTDACAAVGVEDGIERGLAYAEAGADVIQVVTPRSLADLRAYAAAVPHPLMCNMQDAVFPPDVPARDVEALGYRIAVHATALSKFVTRQVMEFLVTLRAEGSLGFALDRMYSPKEWAEFLEVDRYRLEESRYLAGALRAGDASAR
jgi:2-methylisocitrate lyase-like PEP mutase family enzyme